MCVARVHTVVYAALVHADSISFAATNSLRMGFEKYPDPADVKEKQLLGLCNDILFPASGAGGPASV